MDLSFRSSVNRKTGVGGRWNPRCDRAAPHVLLDFAQRVLQQWTGTDGAAPRRAAPEVCREASPPRRGEVQGDETKRGRIRTSGGLAPPDGAGDAGCRKHGTKADGKAAGVKTDPLNREQIKLVGLLWFLQLCCSALFYTLPAVTPFVKQEFTLNQSQVGLLVSALTFGNVLLLVPSGYWIDALGEKKVLLWGLGLMAAIGVGIAFLASANALLILLFLIGVGYSTTAPGTNKAVMNRIPLSWRATVIGLKQTGVTLGGVLAALAVPVILLWGWRTIFVLLGAANLVACLSLMLLYHNRRDKGGTPEPPPRRSLPLQEVFANRRLLLLAGAGFFLGGCQFSILAYTFLYLKDGLALSVTAAGLGVGWVQFTAAVARLGAGFVSDRLLGQRRRPVMIFFAAAMTAALCCGFLLPPGRPAWVAFAVFGPIGMAGMGFNGIYMTFAMELSVSRASGLATAVAMTAVMTGGIVFPPLLGWFVDASGWFAAVWGVMAFLPLAAMALILPIRERCDEDQGAEGR